MAPPASGKKRGTIPFLKKVAQRLAFGGSSYDPVAYWRERADAPGNLPVMWQNMRFNELVDREEWAVIARYFPTRRGTVLDLGCGIGRLSERLAGAFDAYTGVDLDSMVEEAARRYPKLAGGFVAATVESYAYPENAFDFIVCMGVLGTACTKESLPGVARRLVASLRAGGRIVMIEPFHTNRLLTRGCSMTPPEVARLFRGLGLNLDARSGMLFFPGRMLLSEKVFEPFPRLTAGGFWAGETLVRLGLEPFADYAILALTKPG